MPKSGEAISIIVSLDTIDNSFDTQSINEDDLRDIVMYLMFKSLTNLLLPVSNISKTYLSSGQEKPLVGNNILIDAITHELSTKFKASGHYPAGSVTLTIKYPIIIITEHSEELQQ